MPVTIDLTRPHIGRVYDYVLGGTYNYEADRIAAREIQVEPLEAWLDADVPPPAVSIRCRMSG